MNFFNGKKKNEKKEESVFDKNQALIANARSELEISMKALGLNNDDIQEVLSIIDDAQNQIQQIKDSLIGTNIDMHPKEPMAAAEAEISRITKEMAQKVPEKAKEIILRKNENKGI